MGIFFLTPRPSRGIVTGCRDRSGTAGHSSGRARHTQIYYDGVGSVDAVTVDSLPWTKARSPQSPMPQSSARLGNSMGARAGAPKMKLSNQSGDGPCRLTRVCRVNPSNPTTTWITRTIAHSARNRRVTGVTKTVTRKPTAKALLATGIYSVQ